MKSTTAAHNTTAFATIPAIAPSDLSIGRDMSVTGYFAAQMTAQVTLVSFAG